MYSGYDVMKMAIYPYGLLPKNTQARIIMGKTSEKSKLKNVFPTSTLENNQDHQKQRKSEKLSHTSLRGT